MTRRRLNLGSWTHESVTRPDRTYELLGMRPGTQSQGDDTTHDHTKCGAANDVEREMSTDVDAAEEHDRDEHQRRDQPSPRQVSGHDDGDGGRDRGVSRGLTEAAVCPEQLAFFHGRKKSGRASAVHDRLDHEGHQIHADPGERDGDSQAEPTEQEVRRAREPGS